MLSGKTALVTGATSGIGKAIALLFLKNGASVIGVGTNEEKARKLIEEASSDRLRIELCDISSEKDVEKLFATVFSACPKLDILVNNAGITRDGLLMRMTPEDWDKVLDTNLRSCFLTCRHACRPMMKAKGGRIINISSIVGLAGNPGQTNYAASKAGMIGFSKSLAREVASRNILVNCRAPGYIETGMTEAMGQEKVNLAKGTIPLGRLGTPQDIAQAALFLASDMSSYMTGQVLVVDGGLL